MHVCMYVFIKLHITTQSGPVILVILCHSHWSSRGGINDTYYVCMYVCMYVGLYLFIILHLTAQSGPVILVMPLALIFSRGDSQISALPCAITTLLASTSIYILKRMGSFPILRGTSMKLYREIWLQHLKSTVDWLGSLVGCLIKSENPFKCHQEVLYLQPMIPPKRFDIISSLNDAQKV